MFDLETTEGRAAAVFVLFAACTTLYLLFRWRCAPSRCLMLEGLLWGWLLPMLPEFLGLAPRIGHGPPHDLDHWRFVVVCALVGASVGFVMDITKNELPRTYSIRSLLLLMAVIGTLCVVVPRVLGLFIIPLE